MKTVLSVLLIAASASAASAGHIAASYIYGSDYEPASVIQSKEDEFSPSQPIYQRFTTVEADHLAPVPLPYIADKSVAIEDVEEDDASHGNSDEYLHNGHGNLGGGGSDYDEENHATGGETGNAGHDSNGHYANGVAGSFGKSHNEGYYDAAKGQKAAHHDLADVYRKHFEGGDNYNSGDHDHKSHFNKGEEITGYHKVYNKDEFKKDHDFYDIEDGKGSFNKYAYEKQNRGSADGGHVKGGHGEGSINKGEFRKDRFHLQGQVDEADSGHSIENSNENIHNDHEDHEKKQGSGHEKEYEDYDNDEEDDEHDDH